METPTISLSSEQQVVLAQVVSWAKNYTDSTRVKSLGGLAGTGKSTLILKICQESLSRTGRPTEVLAPTGKAVDTLRTKGVSDPKTVHSFVYKFLGKNKDGLKFRSKRHSPDSEAIVIVDEASMMSKKMSLDLERYHRGPILYVGDHGQLPPVDRLSEGKSLVSSPDYLLEKVHRQAKDNPIICLAHELRKGFNSEKITRLSDKGGYSINDPEVLKRVYQEGLDTHFKDLQVITFSNNRRVSLNNKIRKELQLAENTIAPGDKIIFLQNRPPAYNGQQVTADMLTGNVLMYNGGKVMPISLDSLGVAKPDLTYGGELQVDFSYALTCHKAQGSQYPKVLISITAKDYRMLKSDPELLKKWLYTAVTRAETEVHIHIKKLF